MPPRGRYRPNVAAIILDRRNHILFGERIALPGTWQLPQGGIEAGEAPEEAVKREVWEELGTDKVTIIARSGQALRYTLPRRYRGGPYIGQEQIYFLLRFTGGSADIRVDAARTPEFIGHRWVPFHKALGLGVNFKRGVYRAALEEFRPIILGKPEPVASGALVRLRPQTVGDLVATFPLRYAPAVLDALGESPPKATLEDKVRAFLARLDASRLVPLVIETLSGEAIGQLTAFDFAPAVGGCEVGVVLFQPAYWGRGYGREACALFLDFLHRVHHIRQAKLLTHVGNARAQAMFRHLGFQPVGEILEDRQLYVEMTRALPLEQKNRPAASSEEGPGRESGS